MEEKSKNSRILYVIIGFLIAIIIFLRGGKLREISPFGIKFEFPTETLLIQSTSETPIPNVSPNSSTSRPSPIHIVNGNDYSMPEGWFWVCTGDFSTQINGTKKAWYDVGVLNTGLVFVLQPNSSFTIGGAFEVPAGKDVGDCSPYAQDKKNSAISGAIDAQLDRGCGSKCQYVNVIELDKNGNEVSNYWTPQ